MQVASDFQAECETISIFLDRLNDEDFSRETGFKSWTIDMILRHLHVWNKAAFLSLTDEDALQSLLNQAKPRAAKGEFPLFESEYLDGLSGQSLLRAWYAFIPELAAAFSEVDPKQRLPWAGPSMSARSSITARLMETWAHVQAIYDEMGVVRQSSDAIKNIVVLGHNTYGWTFKNRELEIPAPVPQLRLVAPSGAEWTMGEDAGEEFVAGSAEEFCQVVTQTRNIADTSLELSGDNARHWMSIAQCFAGPAVDPPPTGARRMRVG